MQPQKDTAHPLDQHHPHTAQSRLRRAVLGAGESLAGLVLCTLIGFVFRHWGFADENIMTVYLLGIVLNAVLTASRVYSAAYAVLSILAFDYFFAKPSFSLIAYDTGYPVTFLVMLIAALITSALTKRIKLQSQQMTCKAYHTELLLETNRMLGQAGTQENILCETARQLVKLLDRTVIVYPAPPDRQVQPQVFSRRGERKDVSHFLTEAERIVALWVYKNGAPAGASTGTMPRAQCLYLPVRGNEVLAVFGIVLEQDVQIDLFEQNLMLAMLGECTMAMEKLRADESSRQIAIEAQQERLRSNLLRAISHDLRTPLTSISGCAGVLLNPAQPLSDAQKQELYTDIYDDAVWLNALVENLLAITRLENDDIRIGMEPELLSEVIEEALLHISRDSQAHHIKVELEDELLMANMDARLIMQVIINMVDNAIKYTPDGSTIVVSARPDGENARMEVSDNGDGLPDDAKAKLFDIFFMADNARGDGRRGLGLGLHLCKAIVDAHGGEIYVKDNEPTGLIVGFTLHAQEVDLYD